MKYDGYLVHILPTNKCNLQCKYCYSDSSSKKEISTPQDYVEKVTDFVNALPVTVIHIEGGEPLLYDGIFDLIRMLDRKEKVYLVTNGYLITKKIAEKLRDSGLQNIIVSIDYAKQSNSIDKKACLKSLGILNEVGIIPEISVTMFKDNTSEMQGMFDLANIYNIKRIRFGEIVRVGATQKNDLSYLTSADYQILVPQFLKLASGHPEIDSAISLNGNVFEECEDDFKNTYEAVLEKRNCSMNETMITINDRGEIYTCCNLVGLNKFLIGNVHDKWTDIVNGDKYQKIKNTDWKKCPVGRDYHINIVGTKNV